MKKNHIILNIVISSILTFMISISYHFNSLTYDSLAPSDSIVWLIILIVFLIVNKMTYNIRNIKIFKYSFILGLILSVIHIIGFLVNNFILLDISVNNRFILYAFIKIIQNTYIFGIIIANLFNYIDNFNITEKNSIFNKLFECNKKNFIIITIIIFISYIPWILHYYPGICSTDSVAQMLQAAHYRYYTNENPIIHSIIISLCLKIGNLFFNSNNAGIAIYSILQMLLCSFTFSFSIMYINKKNVPIVFSKLLLLFFMFNPLVSLYSITMWKDIPFSLSIVLTTIFTIEIFTNTQSFFSKKKNAIFMILILLLDLLFRRNGILSVILIGIIGIITLKSNYKKYFSIIIIIPLIIYFIITGPIFNIFNIYNGKSKEAMSFPIQLVSRVMKYHYNELKLDERQEIDKYFDEKDYYLVYDPLCADSTKIKFSEEYFKNNKLAFIKTYLKYSFKYPSETIKSFIVGSYGYYYPDTCWPGAYNDIFENENTKVLNINQNPIKKFKYIDFMYDIVNKDKFIIISIFTKCGIYLWISIITIGYYLYKRKYNLIYSFTPVLGVWFFILFSPVFCERRYVYSLILVSPIMFSLCFTKKTN